MDTLEVLEKARELISDPKRWTKAYYATNDDSNWLTPADQSACRFCMVGALAKVADTSVFQAEHSEAYNALADVVVYELCEYVSVFNDRAEHHEVLAAFDLAIAKLKESAHVPQ
ncbi:MAG TPA: hypothetical protein VGK73_31560 [Polyangiaceae bacterium]